MLLSDRVTAIAPSPTLAMAAKALELRAAGVDVINLSAGEPDFGTPSFIGEKAKDAIDKGHTRYTAVDGVPDLKKAIQKKFLEENNLSYDLDQITVNCGAKHSLFNAFMASLNPGDEVIIPAPYWVSYEAMVQLCGGTPVIVRCSENHQFKLTPEQLSSVITDRTKWLVLNSPSNPTGSVYSKEELIALAAVLKKHPHIFVMSDDIYEHIIYAPYQFCSLPMADAELKDRTLSINGLSKSFSMTGWRLGYAAGPKDLIQAMRKIQSQSTSNPCSITQQAAIAALADSHDFMSRRLEAFLTRRDYMVTDLNRIPGMHCLKPEGAFYAYPSCEHFMGTKTLQGKTIETDTDFATYLLEEAQIATVPGSAFGHSPYLRLSYAVDLPVLEKAMDRIEAACEKLSKR